ncbi:MAG TPA: biotin--[acetyl-CoA-carboxylase] ligase [Candidatus Limnocylindrales bacterium]|nr:biotin--[acetyl-CoA-carboxylase] ligase [Candidatus Limnocylindrales bacterium]
MDREAIMADEVEAAIAPWRVRLLAETGSTNSDAAEAARLGEAEGLVVIAEHQTAGKGRLGRTWVSTPRAGLWMSVLLRPKADVSRWGWLPLLTAVALADTVPGSRLKWPNDLLLNGRKAAGILAEAVTQAAVVVGVGLNVSQTQDELPPGVNATSLRLEGLTEDRTALAAEVLNHLRARYHDWAGLHDDYLTRCDTIGRRVRVILPGDTELTGEATTVDRDGRLIVQTEDGRLCPIAAGDVTHVR